MSTPNSKVENIIEQTVIAATRDLIAEMERTLRRHRRYLQLASDWSKNATCSRLRVGGVLVKDDHVISMGYNGAPRGFPHCDHSRCVTHDEPWGTCARDLAVNDACIQSDTRGGHCQNVVHVEINTLTRCKSDPVGSTIYLTHTPCWECFKVLVNAGIAAIVYAEEYRTDERVIKGAERAGIKLVGPKALADVETAIREGNAILAEC